MRKCIAIVLVGVTCLLIGWLAGQQTSVSTAQEQPKIKAKDPLWLYGVTVRPRKFDEPSWTKDTKTIGVEVYRDENNNNLIYVTETGSISVVPGK